MIDARRMLHDARGLGLFLLSVAVMSAVAAAAAAPIWNAISRAYRDGDPRRVRARSG